MGGPAATSDTLNGGPGNDTFCQGYEGATSPGQANDTIIGGGGIDSIDYSQRQNVLNVTIDGQTPGGDPLGNAGMGESDVIGTDVQNVKLGQGGGTYYGNALNNTFTTAPATATALASVIYGLSGDDLVDEGSDLNWQAADTFYGGDGTDTVSYAKRTKGVFILMDGINFSGAGTNGAGTAAVAGVTLTGTITWPAFPVATLTITENDIIGSDVENAIGSSDSDLIVGNANENSLEGNGTGAASPATGDVICGLGGSDTLVGSKALGSTVVNWLHGNDCPGTITLNGANVPTPGDGASVDTNDSVANICLDVGGGHPVVKAEATAMYCGDYSI